jgi:DNA repair exonuclease SbcCD ATPase subunit
MSQHRHSDEKAHDEIERLAKERDEAWEARDEYIRTNVTLRAEIERLHAVSEIQHQQYKQIEAKLFDAAAFLDGMAETLDDMIGQGRRTPAGDDCRAMAAKLRDDRLDPCPQCGINRNSPFPCDCRAMAVHDGEI